ncbi:MAG: MFS transporter [Lachnospiraceae bacterium]|nr:MFS transporter [Lachnospiraceae bacterium]
MAKKISPEKLAERRAKEAKELEKWERVKSKPKPAHYFTMLMVVIGVIYIVDEITSNINSSMQPQILFDFFNITSQDVNDPAYSQAINQMAIVTVFTYLFIFLTPFYRSLADKYGRRLFLALNTCMFGIGLLIIMLSPNIYVYMLGVIALAFVTPNDVQVMYIMEVAPKQHRAKLCSISKAIALVSVSLIGVLRNVFLTDDLSSWRMVYVLPIIVAVAVGLASIFFARETPVFLDERIKYLKSTDEEREAKAEAAKESKSAANGGVINAVKFIFSHKQTRAAALAAFLFSVTTIYTSYYATVMEGGMTTEQVNTALIIYPFANGVFTFASGFFSDKYGRKKTCLGLGTGTVILLTLFILSCQLGWGPIAAGLTYGASIGCLWSMSDTLFLTIPGESVPTEIRASVMGAMTVILAIGMMIGMVIIVVGQNFVNMGWLCLAVCAPFMVIALIILQTKVHETKDVDLDKVTGMEWE